MENINFLLKIKYLCYDIPFISLKSICHYFPAALRKQNNV